jgi:uncharacterized phage-associated protein
MSISAPPYDTLSAANAILERSFKEARQDVSPLKLQKLLYFLNGWHLAITGVPAIDEPFEAWEYGPVVGSIYHQFKDFGRGGITRYAKQYDPKAGEFRSFVVDKNQRQFYEILDAVWENYIGYDALTLSAMTHQKFSPWSRTYENGGGDIPSNDIKDYFVSRVQAAG